MSDVAIHVQGLSKLYHIGVRKPYKTIRESFTDIALAPFRRLGARGGPDGGNSFWALKDVNFEVRRGEVVGIIGRNGAGKSTLLKVLSRITEPTEGQIEIEGRVGSLLEVGTGFHPELTGRENIFLNGAILGMKRAEIAKKFDEIVAFAETEKFLDTPVKFYSSGMYTRLAFAVAAHLEPEILIVDEVLAVGDAQFQRKCMGKMGEVAKEGRTVLFVSHQMAAIQNLCTRVIMLSHGEVAAQGDSDSVIGRYLSEGGPGTHPLADRSDRQGNGAMRFTAYGLLDGDGREIASLRSGQEGCLVLYFRNDAGVALKNFDVAVGIDDQMGQRICHLSSATCGAGCEVVSASSTAIEIRMPRLPLMAGHYGFTLFAKVNGVVADWVQSAGTFNVEAGDFYGTGRLPEGSQGHFLLDHSLRMTERQAPGMARDLGASLQSTGSAG